jgi:DNA-binding CsgD family transcriptional regulator
MASTPLVSFMQPESNAELAGARALGFDKLMYGVDVLDGEIDPPLEIIAAGLTPDYMDTYLRRMREDPIRRLAARGEITVTNTPLTYENTGSSLSIAKDRALTSGDTAMLRWYLTQGVRTGVGFRIRMSGGRHASINFYSALGHADLHLETALAGLFLIGHQLHARIEPGLSKGRDKLLSSREAECLHWIAIGKSNREIADLLGISVDTAKEHVQSLFQKLRVHGRAQAVSRGHVLAYLG